MKLSLPAGKHDKTIPKYSDIDPTIADLIVSSISINSGYTSILNEVAGTSLHDQVPAHTSASAHSTPAPAVFSLCSIPQVGNKTECALLGLVLGLGKHYQPVRDEWPEHSLFKVYTFNSVRKCMSTVIVLPDGTHRVFTKGASEIVLNK